MTDWLKEYVDAIRDDIDASKTEVLNALAKHEEHEMHHINRIDSELKSLLEWKNRATVVLGLIALGTAASLGPGVLHPILVAIGG